MHGEIISFPWTEELHAFSTKVPVGFHNLIDSILHKWKIPIIFQNYPRWSDFYSFLIAQVKLTTVIAES